MPTDYLSEILKSVEASAILEALPEDEPNLRNLDNTPYWRRDVFPVLRNLKPYRLRCSGSTPPWFSVCGRAPEGSVNLYIAPRDPLGRSRDEIDVELACLIRDKGYRRAGFVFWRIIEIVELEGEITQFFGARPKWQLLENSAGARRIDLNVSYAEKDEAKALGARWDPNALGG